MMPELFLADALGARASRCSGCTPPARSAARPPSWRRQLVAAGHPRAGAHGGLREAVRVRGHVGALAADPVHPAAARRRRRLLRPAHPQLHAPVEGARPHRHAGGAQGPAERAEEPVRPPPRARHHLRLDQGVDRCCGTRSATPRRARRPTAPAPWCSARRRWPATRPRAAPPAWIHGTAMRSEPTLSAERDTVLNPQAARLCAADVYKQAGITNPREDVDASRCTCRSAGSSRCGSRTSASPSRARAGR